MPSASSGSESENSTSSSTILVKNTKDFCIKGIFYEWLFRAEFKLYRHVTPFLLTLEHVLYSDGNAKRICWTIKTQDDLKEQFREHAEIFLDKVTDLQSKYIALHVGLFWSIGVFIIKNGDTVKIMLDSDEMVSHLSSEKKSQDRLAEDRKGFINQLATQRNLKFHYEKINASQNIASKML